MVNMNHQTKYPRQRLFQSKVIVQRHTHTHTQGTDFITLPLKWWGNERVTVVSETLVNGKDRPVWRILPSPWRGSNSCTTPEHDMQRNTDLAWTLGTHGRIQKAWLGGVARVDWEGYPSKPREWKVNFHLKWLQWILSGVTGLARKSQIFHPSVQCIHLAAGWRIHAGNATDQWRDKWNAATVCPTKWHFTR